MTKHKRPQDRGFAYDHEHGDVPITMSEEAVGDKVNDAFEHPDSVVACVVFVLHGDLYLKVNGPPEKATLELLEQAVDTYRRILRGQ